jgi:hypothetical protein
MRHTSSAMSKGFALSAVSRNCCSWVIESPTAASTDDTWTLALCNCKGPQQAVLGDCHNTCMIMKVIFELEGHAAAGHRQLETLHSVLTCRVRWRRPGLRCRSQATTLLLCGVMSTVGHESGCAVILYHLRHTRGNDAALQEDAELRH